MRFPLLHILDVAYCTWLRAIHLAVLMLGVVRRLVDSSNFHQSR